MKSIARRTIACLLAVVMLIGIIPAAAATESGELIGFVGSNMTLGNELVLNFMIAASDIDDPDAYTAVVTQAGKTTQLPLREYNAKFYCVSYGVAAKEMTDEVSVYLADGNGDTVSEVYSRSIQDYAVSALNGYAADNALLQTMLVDMLCYGTEAQKYFGYNEDAYANGVLTEEQLAMGGTAAACGNDQVAGENFYGANLSLEDRILLNLFFTAGADVSGMYAEVEYENYRGENKLATVAAATYSADLCKVTVDQIVLADARQDVTVKLYTADGELYGEAVDSVESYVARTTGTAMDALNDAIMCFSDSAYRYLLATTEKTKFTANSELVFVHTEENGTIEKTLGSLFTAVEGVEIDDAKVTVTVEQGADSTVAAEYAANTADWTQGTVTFSGVGTVTVTITDNNYCIPTTATVTITEPAAVEKFEAKADLNFEHTVEGGTIEKTIGDLFAAKADVEIDSENVTVTVTADETVTAEYTAAADWTQGTVTFTGVGTVTVTITDNHYCIPTTATVTITEPAAVEKFEAKADLNFEHTVEGGTIEKTIGDLFAAKADVEIDSENVTVTVTADETVTAEYTEAADWTQGTVTFSGVGTVTVTITDNHFCIPTTATVTITEPAAVEKFEAKADLNFEHTVEGGTIEKTIGDLFAAKADVEIDAENVTVTVTADETVTAEYTAAADWTQGTVTFSGVGTVTVTITDNHYCIPTTATVTITEPAAVEKFEAKADLNFEHTVEGGTIEKTIGDLFAAKADVEIDAENVEVTYEADGVTVEYTEAADWTQGTVTFSGVGTVTVTITDNNYCIPTIATVTITEPAEAEKFDVVFENTDTYLYRVGNMNTVNVGNLFEAVGDARIGNVTITVEALNDAVVSGTYTPNTSDWKSGTISFSGTGPVVVTIDDDAYATEKKLNLEVVDAKNSASATSVLSATGSNVVLLCDTAGGFSVSGGYTLYGNGFTVALPTTYQSKYSAGFVGWVNLDSGNLDNVRIEGPVYPETYIYRSQAEDSADSTKANYFYNAVIINSGNCTISNSYISGCRSAVYVKAGNNVVIENTTISGGSFANLEVQGASSVTLRDLTTIQQEVSDSYGNGKSMIGVGVMVWSGTPAFFIEGDLEQYNWVNKAQWDSIVPAVYQSAFPAFFTASNFAKFQHQRDGVTYVNMAFTFACNWDTARIHDNHTNAVPYEFSDTVTLGDLKGGVLSVANAGSLTDELFIAPQTYESTGYAPVAPVFTFVNNDEEADDPDSAADPYCVYADGTLKIGLAGSSRTLDLSGISVLKNGVAMNYTVYLNGNAVTGSTATINAADGTNQMLTIKAVSDDAGYDKDGNAIVGTIEYTWTISLEVATLSFPAPVWNMASYTFGTTAPTKCYYVYYKTSTGYAEVVPIFEGIKVDYYDKSGTLVNLDLSGTTVSKTDTNALGSEYVYTLADGSSLAIKYSSGYKSGVTAYYFAKYDGKQYVYPSDPSANGNVRPGVSDYDFNVKYTYTFTDPNGQKTDTITVNWYNAKASNSSNVSTIKWGTLDTVNGKDGSSCITPDTLITLADGTVKRMDAMTGEEELLVWNHTTGEMEAIPVAYIVDHNETVQEREVIKLTFFDGRDVEVIGEHVFFDVTLNKYVAISDNAEDYIGHEFLALTADNSGVEPVSLVNVEREVRMTELYEIVSYEHLTCFTDGLLSTSAYLDGLLNIFEMDPETWTYSAEGIAEDIETYGLYTYADFEGLISEEAFELYNAKYLKIAVGKGYLVWEDILELIDIYFDAEVQPLQ